MAGAGILQDIDRMVKLTEAVVKSTSLPVTVKTRLGWDDNTKIYRGKWQSACKMWG